MTLTNVSTTWVELIVRVKMTSTQVVKMSVDVNNNSSFKNYTHTRLTIDAPWLTMTIYFV